jgi:predicted HTH domain antitoxin
MGRTLPSTTQIALDTIAELKPFYEALCRSDQLILDRFFEAILQHRAAIGNAANLLPMEVMPFAILLEEHKRNNHTFNEIFGLLAEIQRKLFFEELEKRLNVALPFDPEAEKDDAEL